MTTESAVRIRPATVADADRIGQINVESWRATYTGIVPPRILDGMSAEQRAGYWRQRIEDAGERLVLVAEGPPAATRRRAAAVLRGPGRRATTGSPIDGYVVAGPARDHDLPPLAGEVYAIYVHPRALRRGFGRALLGAASRELAERGYTPLVLWVITANRAARRFYEAQGWQADGTAQPIDFDGTPVEEVRYRLA